MNIEAIVTIAVLGASIISGVVTWLISDAKSKTRATIFEEQLQIFKDANEEVTSQVILKVGILEIGFAKAEQKNEELQRTIDKLEQSKASREVVDGFRNEVNTLRQDIDKRFDKLERLIENLK